MTFPQTNPVDATRNGQEFWRLFTRLESSGDIYESDVSGLGFALGPDSDFSCINITYFDRTKPSKASTIELSNDKPFVGRIDALASQQYSTGQQARIFISPTELLPQEGIYRPKGFVEGDDSLIIEDINIDVIQYLNSGPADAAVPQRTDRTHFFQAPEIPATGAAWYVMPYYSRRYASVMFNADAGAIDFDIEVFGSILVAGTSLAVTNDHPQISLRGPTTVNSSIVNFEITADDDGMYDLLIVKLSSPTPPGSPLDSIPLKIRTSDKVG